MDITLKIDCCIKELNQNQIVYLHDLSSDMYNWFQLNSPIEHTTFIIETDLINAKLILQELELKKGGMT